MNVDVITAVATSIMALATAAAAVAAFRAARTSAKAAEAAERSVTQQMRSHNLTGLREFILGEYLEREFKVTDVPMINGKKVNLLRAAKSEAINQYKQNQAEWDKVSTLSNRGAWQNQVAFETAWALEHLGVAAFTGVLPLRVLLGIAGDAIIDDWLLCRSWVKSYRESEHTISQAETTGTATVHYLRRHAEWLVLVAVAWMTRYWFYPNCDHVAEWYGGKQNIPTQIQSLSNADGTLMPQTVRDDIMSLTGIEVKL
jgi:hypothetical protein